MLKKISNLGTVLSKTDQKSVFGGNEIGGGGLCSDLPGSIPCYCNGSFVGCSFTIGYCAVILCA